ncbi:MAG: flagellar biosynthesis anti-sigma factor FlgM [Deltaproteobacteria bacterium]|nr:flagellar biosynthesis anti-sigma factor FlgM [Deltaproteobacteria bacterium]
MPIVVYVTTLPSRLEALRAEIKAGTYHADAGLIADAILMRACKRIYAAAVLPIARVGEQGMPLERRRALGNPCDEDSPGGSRPPRKLC